MVVPGNGQELLGMPDFKLLKKQTISCNTIGGERQDKDSNCSTNRHCTHDARSKQYSANTGLESRCKRTNNKMFAIQTLAAIQIIK